MEVVLKELITSKKFNCTLENPKTRVVGPMGLEKDCVQSFKWRWVPTLPMGIGRES